jgi:hypothetical protein
MVMAVSALLSTVIRLVADGLTHDRAIHWYSTAMYCITCHSACTFPRTTQAYHARVHIAMQSLLLSVVPRSRPRQHATGAVATCYGVEGWNESDAVKSIA